MSVQSIRPILHLHIHGADPHTLALLQIGLQATRQRGDIPSVTELGQSRHLLCNIGAQTIDRQVIPGQKMGTQKYPVRRTRYRGRLAARQPCGR